MRETPVKAGDLVLIHDKPKIYAVVVEPMGFHRDRFFFDCYNLTSKLVIMEIWADDLMQRIA